MFFGIGRFHQIMLNCEIKTNYFIGALVLAAIDSVPSELVDNAIVLGVLSFIVAFVFLIDMSEKMGKREKTHTTQTDTSSIDRHFTKGYHIGTVSSEVNLVDHDGNDRKSIYNQSMRSKNSESINIQSNPMHNQSPPPNSSHHHHQQQHMDAKSTGASSGYNSYQNHQHAGSISHEENYHPPSHISEDIVQSKTYPTAQMPTFSKVKHGQYPTVVNHLESEPYKKILSRTSNPNTYSRYQDQAHQENPTFYEDFSKFRQESYYQGPKVDNKLMVIRDYSSERRQSQCNCHHPEHEDGVKAGYVAKVAKLYDDQSKVNDISKNYHSREPRSLDTHV
jgi:hypothetical protein